MKKEITITREQFFEFVKSKNEDEESASPQDFLKYFDNYQKTGKKTSWNLAVFFFNILWFLYRKMYLYGVLILLGDVFVNEALTCVSKIFLKTDSSAFIFLFGLVYLFLVMLYANYIYLYYAKKKIIAGTFNSGTNSWIVWVVLIASFLISTYKYWSIFL